MLFFCWQKLRCHSTVKNVKRLCVVLWKRCGKEIYASKTNGNNACHNKKEQRRQVVSAMPRRFAKVS
jgi:hypothetical protein